jgi:hypothetical protein
MMIPIRRAAMLAVALFSVAPAQAATGQIDSFAASALSVQAGSTVDFVVSYSVNPETWPLSGGSDLVEPAPQAGSQTWLLNWYASQTETVVAVSLQAAGQAFNDLPTVPAGSGHSGSWSFSMLFATPGQFELTAGGGWEVVVESESGQEIGTRNCSETGEEGASLLYCDAWAYEYPQLTDRYSTGASFSPVSLQIEVLAAVPEPHTVAFWLLGLGCLAARSRVTRR